MFMVHYSSESNSQSNKFQTWKFDGIVYQPQNVDVYINNNIWNSYL